MKTIPPPCPEPEYGRKYWRSIDQLEDNPDFRAWLEREFPAGASEFTDPVSRRHFVKIMSASFLLAGFGLAGTGCRRPVEEIHPFAKTPEGFIHGVPRFYATAMPVGHTALPLVVKASEGRPTKVEGNAIHPDSNGATNGHAQASILDLYDPDRAQRFTHGTNSAPREAAWDALASLASQLRSTQGRGLSFLLEASSSPSRARLIASLATSMPEAKWYSSDASRKGIHRRAAQVAFGSPVTPYLRLEEASVILSLDCDFLGSEADSTRHIRGFARGRKPERMNRLYIAEGLMTITGMNADHRLRVPTGLVQAVAARLALEITRGTGSGLTQATASALEALGQPASASQAWAAECAKDLVEAAKSGKVLILAGERQPLVVHLLAYAMNSALGAIGHTIQLLSPPRTPQPEFQDIAQLAAALGGGQVQTLIILGGNPALTAPADLDWAVAQAKAATVIRLGYHEDETFAALTPTGWHLPAAHYLESWGDAQTSDGTLVPIQPLIEPLFGGVTELEVLARLSGQGPTRPYDITRETFGSRVTSETMETQWRRFLHDGFLAGSASAPATATLAGQAVAAAIADAKPAAAPSAASLEVVFHDGYSLDGGRSSNNGWLQELPDPVTKITWHNAVLLSRKTAGELSLKSGDQVQIELGSRRITGPVLIQPGFADYSLGLTLGYGRTRCGRIGGDAQHLIGFNAYPLRTTASESFGVGARITKTSGKPHQFSLTQEHGSMEGRPIIREGNLEDYKKFPRFARNMDLEAHSEHIPTDPKTGLPLMMYKHPYRAYEEAKADGKTPHNMGLAKSEIHQWGMSIDLNACVGCTSCVLACQSENNVPIVGHDQIARGREMHWLRIDRYFSGISEKSPEELIDDPQVVNQPMLCMHCENAPCESVCPVNATVHDAEGVNVMAYNRCVGTRYCSNNCPYKVRRFNFFDYNKRSLEQLVGPFYSTPMLSSTDGKWDMLRWFKKPEMPYRPQDDWDLMSLVKNPDVSVRMRGVMEKCTFCIQRIEQAKISQKVKARASGDVAVPDGAIKTACQQACPAEAIVFGNLVDPNSEVSKLKKQDRDYSVLGFLDTRPRTTYLAKIRNPNPRMPDYHKVPLNIDEYVKLQQSSPYSESHGAGPGHTSGGGHAAEAVKKGEH